MTFKTCDKCNGLGLDIKNNVATGCSKCDALGYLTKKGKSLFEVR